jgi:15-cis-phytoene desaturase
VIVIGAGLAGLTAASWNDGGMQVESGFHRHIGYYKEMPKVLKKVGVKVDDIVMWENKMDIRVPDKKDTAVCGIAPFYAFLDFLRGIFGKNHVLSLKDKMSLIPFFIMGFYD